MACEIHIGDIGTRFLFTIQDCDSTSGLDISSSSSVNIVFKKPSGATLNATGVFLTDGTDGKVYYDSVSGDIDESGYWRVQGKVTFASGSVFYSDIHKFQVYANL